LTRLFIIVSQTLTIGDAATTSATASTTKATLRIGGDVTTEGTAQTRFSTQTLPTGGGAAGTGTGNATATASARPSVVLTSEGARRGAGSWVGGLVVAGVVLVMGKG